MTERKPMEPVAWRLEFQTADNRLRPSGFASSLDDAVRWYDGYIRCRAVPLYTADQIRALVEEVRAEWEKGAAFAEADGVPVARHTVNHVFDAILARLEK